MNIPSDTRLRDVDVVVIGAGFAGVYAVHRLSSRGLSVRGFEAGADVGGTWYWNRYPGARCDVESMDYSYGFSDKIQQNWDWGHLYSFQPSIHQYISHVADETGARSLIEFETSVVSQSYDAETQHWTVKTDKGEIITCRYCVMATGNLTVPLFPDISGLDTYEGEKYHSSRWPKEPIDFTGKRVAIFGTGATGVQIIPEVAKDASKLFVFQRTANFSLPARNRPLTPEEIDRVRKKYPELRNRARKHVFGIHSTPEPTRSVLELSEEEAIEQFEKFWAIGGSLTFQMAFTDFMRDERANKRLADFVRSKIRQTVKDPKTAQTLCPNDHPIGAKRICIDTGYFETYNLPHVELINLRERPVVRITPNGIESKEGLLEVDVIIFATGFDAITGAVTRIDITGRNGLKLAKKWSERPSAYMGIAVANFPNMFIITGPGSPSVKSNMVTSIEQHVELIDDIIGYMQKNDLGAIDADETAENEWVDYVNEVASKTLFVKSDSWYNGANVPGKARNFVPFVGGVNTYRLALEAMMQNNLKGFIKETLIKK
jgi:cyclohexanone monooxygenase